MGLSVQHPRRQIDERVTYGRINTHFRNRRQGFQSINPTVRKTRFGENRNICIMSHSP